MMHHMKEACLVLGYVHTMNIDKYSERKKDISRGSTCSFCIQNKEGELEHEHIPRDINFAGNSRKALL